MNQLAKKIAPNATGLAALLLSVAVASLFVPRSTVPGIFWGPIYLMWAAGALFVWHKFKVKGLTWIWVALGSVAGAILWYGIAFAAARLFFGDKEPDLSVVFDVLVALILSPGLTLAFLTGWVREWVQSCID